MRNPVLAGRLRDSLTVAARLLRSPKRPGCDAAAVTEVLLCVLPGYLMQLALAGPGAVKRIPRTLEKGLGGH